MKVGDQARMQDQAAVIVTSRARSACGDGGQLLNTGFPACLPKELGASVSNCIVALAICM